MKLFVSFAADLIDQMMQRATIADVPEEVAKIAQSIERGNRLWSSWAESHGGKTINVGGDEGRLEIEADYLSELPGIREQYEGATGSPCSVGIGTKLSEADRSLKAAKLQGGDRIQLYTEEVDEILAEDEKEESDLEKANPAMNAGSMAGFSGASRSQPAAPAAPTEGSEHSENEVLQNQIENAPAPAEAPKQTAADFEQLFHQLAAAQKEEPAGKPSGVMDGVREQVVQVLQQVRGNAQELEQMKQTNPEMYQSVVGVIQAMIAMAQSTLGDSQQPVQEEVQKAEGKVGRCKWKLGERRCQRQVTGNYCHDHKDHWANKILRKDLMPGGKGDDIGDSSFDSDQLAEGMRVEMEEHGLDEARAKEVAKDHLTEDPNYYKMEKALPRTHAENQANQAGFLNHPVAQDTYMAGTGAVPQEHTTSLVPGGSLYDKGSNPAAKIPISKYPVNPEEWQAHAANFDASRNPVTPTKLPVMTPFFNITQPAETPSFGGADKQHEKDFWQDTEAQAEGRSLADLRRRAAKGIKSKAKPEPSILDTDPTKKGELEKAALVAGKTGRHQVKYPVGSQIDAGPTADHEAGKIKVAKPDGTTAWRSVRAGVVMSSTDGTPTSSRNE